MTSYVGVPQPFNASNDEWVLYIQRFEHFLKIDNDNDRCHLLLALIGAPTLLSSLCAPKQPGELKFKDICDTLKRHYLPQPIKIAERYRFYNRKQLEGESAADYLAHLRQLASTCQFRSFLDEALCDRLVCGVRDPDITLLKSKIIGELRVYVDNDKTLIAWLFNVTAVVCFINSLSNNNVVL